MELVRFIKPSSDLEFRFAEDLDVQKDGYAQTWTQYCYLRRESNDSELTNDLTRNKFRFGPNLAIFDVGRGAPSAFKLLRLTWKCGVSTIYFVESRVFNS